MLRCLMIKSINQLLPYQKNRLLRSFKLQIKMLAWALILSVTLLSTTILMIIAQYLAILTETMEYFQTSRTMVLLLSNSFNIFYILISPLLFLSFKKYYYQFVLASSFLIGFAAVGRYVVGTNYQLALLMAIIVAIAHIPIINAPYGLLKLFPDDKKGYAASIPLFLPVVGINFWILYDMIYITDSSNALLTNTQIHNRIDSLSLIIAVIGVFSAFLTITLLMKLKEQIVQREQSNNTISSISVLCVYGFCKEHKLNMIALVCWGSIVGINWTYGTLFGVIFQGQGLTQKEIALLGLAANLSTAIFSNMGTYIKNKFGPSNTIIINTMNLLGFIAAILLQASKYVNFLSNMYLVIGLVIVLRAGFSSFVSLAFIEMQKSGISSVLVSSMFFWVANAVNLAGMQIVDLVNIDISLSIIIIGIALCINFGVESQIKSMVISN